MDPDELNEDAPLTADEILRFGPVVEAQVWTPIWLQEARAPIAVAAGRPKLGKVFDDDGVGRAVVIRPCMSRGRRVRGLPPIYTPQMLEANSGVYDGWPMFTDHVPAELAQVMAKRGRSVKELGGQVLKGGWLRDYVHEDDAQYGYRPGATVADIWATPLIRRTVGENPNLLHCSINAWPTSGKPGPCPWRPAVKGMLIEGIRRQPQGSVDYVVRGGAGGRLLIAEAAGEEGEWPELGEWSEDDTRFVVSLAESFYASAAMDPADLKKLKPAELRAYLAEHAEHLLPALSEGAAPAPAPAPAAPAAADGEQSPALTEADVERIVSRLNADVPTVEDFETRMREQTEELVQTRETQRTLSEAACALIESAENIPASWKADLKARYAMSADGPSPALLVEAEVEDGVEKTPAREVLLARVREDLQHTRDLIAEARGKPRVTGEGGAKPDAAADRGQRGKVAERRSETPYWREQFAQMGLAESAEKAHAIYGDESAEED